MLCFVEGYYSVLREDVTGKWFSHGHIDDPLHIEGVHYSMEGNYLYYTQRFPIEDTEDCNLEYEVLLPMEFLE